MAMIAGTAYCIKSFPMLSVPTLWVSFVLSYYIPISFYRVQRYVFSVKRFAI